MMKKTGKIIPFICFLAFLFACKSEVTYVESCYKKIAGEKQGHFRGVKIGATMDEVKAKEENSHLKDDEASFLYYDFPLKGEDSYTVSYDFYDGALYEIEMNAYLDTKETANKVFNKLKADFNEQFGDNFVDAGGYTVWSGEADNGNEIEIAMIEDSENYGYIQLLISDLDA